MKFREAEQPQVVKSEAQRYYAAYTANSDNLNYQGLPCPAWADLPQAIRDHWCAVVIAAQNPPLVISPLESQTQIFWAEYEEDPGQWHAMSGSGNTLCERRFSHGLQGPSPRPPQSENRCPACFLAWKQQTGLC